MKLSCAIFHELDREYGDGFYLVNPDAFAVNYHEFLNAFRTFYPKSNIAYSYKSNYTPKLCQLVREWGGYAEVVSRMEYELARALGVAPERIIFNGPYKSAADIEQALKLGSIVNLDSPYQVDIVDRLARRFSNRRVVVGIRVTFPVPSTQRSRFGFDADSSELGNIFDHLRRLANICIGGLHCHFLTPKRSVQDYRFITDRMLLLTAKHFGDTMPMFINLGGGYFSRMKEELRCQFGVAVPTYEDYAETMATRLATHYSNGDGPELILEPGICLTADAARFVAKVIDVHELGSRKLALVSGSIYDIKPTLNSRNLPIEVIPCSCADARTIEGNVDVVGDTCMEHDVLFTGFKGRLSVGDYVIFDNVGAYTNVLRPPFIRECPAMLAWSSVHNRFELLKRKEVFHDVFNTYVFS